MKTGDLRRLAENLELLAQHIEKLKLPPDVAASWIRGFAKKLNQNRPGRPSGSKTRTDTYGVKRAREHLEMTEIEGIGRTRAAAIIAEKYGVTESAVFHDRKRHERRVVEEARREADEARWLLAQTMMSMYPDAFEKLRAEFRAAMESSVRKLGDLTTRLTASMWEEHAEALEREIIMVAAENLLELHASRRNTTDSEFTDG